MPRKPRGTVAEVASATSQFGRQRLGSKLESLMHDVYCERLVFEMSSTCSLFACAIDIGGSKPERPARQKAGQHTKSLRVLHSGRSRPPIELCNILLPGSALKTAKMSETSEPQALMTNVLLEFDLHHGFPEITAVWMLWSRLDHDCRACMKV